ncbi:MAG TPA: PIN domain-containing protein [Acidobacteriota bacterium]|jgi:toxin-antitoxin system PIN domain toxin|nr:PIN domain-containing protein [Acidobacteriota bacterium]
MLSLDSNLLFYAFNSSSPWHSRAVRFLSALHERQDVVISELVLIEFYTLLRNPAVVERPLTPAEAVDVIEVYRTHPRWRLEGFPNDSPRLHGSLWVAAREPNFARRRVYDARLALTLIQQGVREFATANVADFADFGFVRVWNPLTD